MKLVIDRAKWWRGHGGSGSALLRPDGAMCCLGFLGEACEVEFTSLLNIPYPMSMLTGGSMMTGSSSRSEKWPAWLFDLVTTVWALKKVEVRYQLSTINDHAMPDVEREEALIAEFAKHGVEVEFIN